MAKQSNFVYYLLEREVGVHRAQRSRKRCVNYELQMLAEDKAASRDAEEVSCQLPRNPRSTLLMAFSPDCTKIASTHGDHNIYICDVKTGRCLHTLEGHPRTPWCVAFHPSSNDMVASGCLGGEVRVWDLHGGSEVWMTQQNWVIASLAFHPFDQVLVIATYNELYFWDWNKSQPFARCKTACEREKVRFVKFDALGHKLITGIANVPIVQSNRPETTRTLPSRFAALIEHYNRVLEARRELQRNQIPTTHNGVGTDPVVRLTNDRPTSPAQLDSLQSARSYAHEVTSESRSHSMPDVASTSGMIPSFVGFTSPSGDQSWRFRDPMLLREPPVIPANTEQRNNQTQSEMSLPSSLIQALVRLQRSLEILTQTRLNASADRNSYEQAHLRERIEEILNRLFNLYASITPLRILMNEVFQDLDREALMAEVNRESAGPPSGNSSLDNRLQELRQQLTRLLERIFSSEADRNALSTGERPLNVGHHEGLSTLNPPNPQPRTESPRPTVRPVPQRIFYASQVQNSTSSVSRDFSLNASEHVPVSVQLGALDQGPFSRMRRQSTTLPSAVQAPSVASTSDTPSGSGIFGTTRSYSASSEQRGSGPAGETTTTRLSISIPRLQIDMAESASDESVLLRPPGRRPRSPPLSSMVNQPNRQQYVDYQNMANGSGAFDERIAGGNYFLHPNYVASLLDETTPRNNNALQLVFNRDVARTFLGAADFAVVNNVISLTHRIQCWDFSRLRIPDISDAQANVVVSECKIHNDASVDVSSDGRLLATLVPGNVGLPANTVVGVYSLEKHNFGSCLYRHYFGPNVISVSLSPLSRYILVGLASRRVIVSPNEKQVVAQVFQLVSPSEGDRENLELVRNIQQGGSSRVHVSLNSTRWLPQPGQGIVYGTNRGDLRICRPGPAKENEGARRRLTFAGMQSTSTQTVSPQTQSAGTQTGLEPES